jgi:hypothetical protein
MAETSKFHGKQPRMRGRRNGTGIYIADGRCGKYDLLRFLFGNGTEMGGKKVLLPNLGPPSHNPWPGVPDEIFKPRQLK